MKPSNEDARPRQDGWFEHVALWSEVVVGTVLGTREQPNSRWEVIETRHGAQVQYGYTMWFKVRDQATGQEFVLEPKPKPYTVTVLTQDPLDTKCGEPTEPSDTQGILNVIAGLGAEFLASRDDRTGEIICPNYTHESHIEGYGAGQKRRGLIEHLRMAHGEPVADDAKFEDVARLHGRCHQMRLPEGKKGFPHRHAHEDLSMF